MSEFFAEYGLFLLKTVTLVAAIVFVVGSAAAASRKAAQQEGLEVENLNEKYRSLARGLRKAIMKKDERKAESKAEKQRAKEAAKSRERRPRGFVIDFKGDLKATGVQSLREEISAILEVADKTDQIVVRLDNHGGVVHEHGLAASQLVRIRRRGIPLVVVVDKVAASGGYLMACVANRICAAPFAIVGSIGVIAQIPNFNRMLDTHGVEFEMVTAGEFKRTVTMFGKNTDKERSKLKEQLEDIHSLFKAAVQEYRPQLDLERVATGEYWYGSMAMDLQLVDELKTSDELLAELAADHDLFQVTYKVKQPLQKRLMSSVDGALEKLDAAGWRRKFESGLPR